MLRSSTSKKWSWPLLRVYAANLDGLGDHVAEVSGEIGGTKQSFGLPTVPTQFRN